MFTVSTTPACDPSGTVVGLADATGRYLPLACTLNCTVAIDHVAEWLGLSREEIAADSAGVVVLPYFDGERTPNVPHAAASIVGLRHTTTAGQILRASYEGAVASLLGALDVIELNSSGIETDVPLILAGGGSKGSAWQECIAALSGRSIRIAEEAEPAAMGAAFQAVAVLEQKSVDAVAGQLGRVGPAISAARAVDYATLERIRRVQDDLSALNNPC